MYIQTHKAQKTPSRLNVNRVTLRHIIIKLSEFKTILKQAREKKTGYIQGNLVRLCADFSRETIVQERMG